MGKAVKGYKCFDMNLKCRDMQFEVGKTYEHEGDVKMCRSGFHFHEDPSHLYRYYDARDSRVCEVLAYDVESGDDKSVCRKIEVVKEIPYIEGRSLNGSGSGSGYGDGYGYGSGSGDGDGSGYGYGYGYGYGDAYGSGYGSGSGDGDGSVYGYGFGSGDGDGDGYGSGYGSGYCYGDGKNIIYIISCIRSKAA
jgi:hypothetical protein